jgi:hypothetical protein
MPLSIAAGYTRDIAAFQFSLTAEYFLKLNEYNIITPRNSYFLRPDTINNSATSELLKLVDARRAVLNLGLGLGYVFTSRLKGYFSFTTDLSYDKRHADPNDDGTRSNTSSWDQYHSQVGINLKRRTFNLRAGLLFTYGTTSRYRQPVNFDNPNESNLLEGDPHDTHAHNVQAGLLLSYLHNF